MSAYLLPDDPCRRLADVEAAGLGGGLAAANAMGRGRLLDVVEASGLRGRDHAAVGVAAKWAALAAGGADAGDRYLVANATDSEPGSFTDRALLRSNPFAVIDGIAVASLALGARDAFIVLRSSFTTEYEILTTAIAEAEMAGWLERVSVKCVRAGDDYLLFDDRAVLEVVEGRPAVPRRFPPDVDGLFAAPERDGRRDRRPAVPNPTAVESVETLANVGAIAVNGSAWFRSMGTAVSPGNVLCTITGDVVHHGVVEAPLGRRLYDVIEEGGRGFLPASPPKAVLSGVSSPVLTRSRLAAPMSWEGLGAVGASLGRAAFTVYGEPTDMLAVAHQVASYLYVESCGWCPACKFGGGEVTAYLARLVAGTGEERDIEALGARLATVTDGRRCDLALRQRDVVSSILRAFPGDVNGAAERPTGVQPRTFAPIEDIVDGVAVPAAFQARKRADGALEATPVRLTRY